jgi:hypothetical protein
MFAIKRVVVIKAWRKMHDKELHNFTFHKILLVCWNEEQKLDTGFPDERYPK